MRNQIWKYVIEMPCTQTSIEMQKGAEILSVQKAGFSDASQEKICIWALVNPTASQETRYFEIFETGEPIASDMGVDRKYLSTIQFLDGRFVCHVFERLN